VKDAGRSGWVSGGMARSGRRVNWDSGAATGAGLQASTCLDHKQRGSVDVDAATCSVVVASSDCLKSGAPQVCSQQIQLTAVYVSTTFVFFYIVQTIC
jgi:hypothetical protein